MKRNEIADFRLASVLKEHNYHRECLFRVDEKDSLYSNGHMVVWNKIKNCYSAPLLSEVSDWILEKFEIFIEITYNDYGDGKFNFSIINTVDDSLLIVSVKTYSTKHAALESAILTLFRKLGNKSNTTTVTARKIEEYEPETNKVKAELL